MLRIKPIILSIFLIVAIFACGLFISVFLVRNRLDNQVFGDRFLPLNEVNRVEITPTLNNLNIIILTLKNPNIENDEDFVFELRHKEDEVIRSMSFKGANVGDPSDIRFQFEPIADSKSRRYILSIITEESEKSVSVKVDDQDRLVYRSYYRSINEIQSLKNFANRFGSNISNDLGFLMLWGLPLTLSIYGYNKARKSNTKSN